MNAAQSEILRSLARSLDPVAFARQFIEPDDWQIDLLRSDSPQIILNNARQTGKSSIVAILALFHALNNDSSLVLIYSASLRQAQEVFKKVVDMYRELDRPLPSTTETSLTLQLHNKSRVVSLPSTEKTTRGFSSPSLILVDEASRVSDDIFYGSISPMRAVSQPESKIILLSTPAGRRGFFYKIWTDGGSSWKRITIKADQCPRISKEWLEEQRRALGERYYNQEFCSSFEENDAALFSHDLIFASLRSDLKEWDLDIDDVDTPEEDDVEIIEEHETKAEDKERAEAGNLRERERLKTIMEWELGEF